MVFSQYKFNNLRLYIHCILLRNQAHQRIEVLWVQRMFIKYHSKGICHPLFHFLLDQHILSIDLMMNTLCILGYYSYDKFHLDSWISFKDINIVHLLWLIYHQYNYYRRMDHYFDRNYIQLHSKGNIIHQGWSNEAVRSIDIFHWLS